jgi:hypothetical protein
MVNASVQPKSEGEIAMATVATGPIREDGRPDYLSGTPRAHALDRWIYVASATLFIVIVLVGFIPDSMMKVQMIKAGLRPPFPPVLHAHAVLMGGFLLFLLGQTWWVATGKQVRHERAGPFGGMLALALVVVGFILAPTMYHQVAGGLSVAPPEALPAIRELLTHLDNILLLQLQAGLLFALFIGLGLAARRNDPGFHKRMMLIAPAMALGAAFARMTWLPTTMPQSPVTIQLYQILTLAPLFVWDLLRNRRIHRAYLVLGAAYVPVCLLVNIVWDTPWWHDMAHRIMRV